jgi:hypothetical protein
MTTSNPPMITSYTTKRDLTQPPQQWEYRYRSCPTR